ncbi:Clavaminate synthase-like protein [Nemania abortiva]|nr:Clavaminate synthase-like protein [Nemania abortiva]
MALPELRTGGIREIATVDLSSFITSPTHPDRTGAARELVRILHETGFVKITGHGFAKHEIDEALSWARKLFALPYEEKMKAPHPVGNIHHRGYSGIGQEKVYMQDDLETQGSQGLRKISDYKESYEIGSEHDPAQTNIWLPEDVLLGFRGSMNSLYARLVDVSRSILDAIGLGLGLDADAHAALMELVSEDHCQLRLLHYPPIGKEKLQHELLTRMPAHTDWGTFTILFQDDHGGLELKDPQSGEFLLAEPHEGALVLNVGDMLQRFTNDHFISAVHQVSVPSQGVVNDSGIPARYSIPFFVMPGSTHTIRTLPNFITAEHPRKYEPVVFDEYGLMLTKYQYETIQT